MSVLAACQGGGQSGPPAAQVPAGPAPEGVVVGDTFVPLPTGDWTKIATLDATGSNNRAAWSGERTVLVSRIDGVVDRIVMILSQRLSSHRRYNLTTACRSETFHYSEARRVNAMSNDCWHVRTLSFGLAGDPHPVNLSLAEYAEREGVYVPITALGTRFIRTQGREKVEVEYLWNVDLLDPRFDGKPALPADWSGDAIGADPVKQAVLDAVVLWSEEWYPTLGRSAPTS